MRDERNVAVFSIFENLTDPRVDRTKDHLLLDIVVIALCATLADADSWVDVARFGRAKEQWFRTFLALPNGIPSHDTFGRVLSRLDTAEFLACLQTWLKTWRGDLAGKTVNIDGKTLRGSFDKASGKSALHLVTAWASEARLVLGQVATEQKSNEITAIPLLLDLIEIAGAVVTIDAMGCQKAIAAKIRERGADYVLALKDNQPTLHAEVSDYFEKRFDGTVNDPTLRRHIEVERSHGRDERREYAVLPVPATLTGRDDWRDLTSIGMVTRIRTINSVETGETSYYLMSLPPKVKAFAKSARQHWGIEEPPTLDARCNFFRRQEPNSQRQRSSHRGHFPTLGTVHPATGHFGKREYPRQTQTRQLGSRHPASHTHRNSRRLRCDCPARKSYRPKCDNCFEITKIVM